MYAYLSGQITALRPMSVVLEVNQIGYELRTSLLTSSSLAEGQQVKLFTYLLVREDAHTLFGFVDEQEKNVFLQLIGVSGVGAVAALTMLSAMSAQALCQSIAQEDLKSLLAIKGIGDKTARRMILELKDKMTKQEMSAPSKAPKSNKDEALAALMVLGIVRPAAEKLIENILSKNGTQISTEEIIRLALKQR